MEENFWNNIDIVKAAYTDMLEICEKHEQELKNKKMEMPFGWSMKFDYLTKDIKSCLFGVELYEKYGICASSVAEWKGDYRLGPGFGVVRIRENMGYPFCKEIAIDVDELREKEKWLLVLYTDYMKAWGGEREAAYLSEVKKYKPDFMVVRTDPNKRESTVMKPYDPDVKHAKALYWKLEKAKDIFRDADNIRTKLEAIDDTPTYIKIEQLKQQIVELESKL